MASTTMVMTALVALERCDLADEVAIPDARVGVGRGSSIYRQRATYRLETLLLRADVAGSRQRRGGVHRPPCGRVWWRASWR